jgi:hypothetical protein
MRDVDRHDDTIVESSGELSEADLECVVGGLARPWTETDAPVAPAGDDWVAEPIALL